MRGSYFFQRLLQAAGVEYIFGILGREAQVLRFRGLPRPKWILVRNEFTAGIAAEVYARLSGRPQVAFSTFGPGATNLATGAASALLDRSPLLAISAQVESGARLWGLTHQCIDQVSMMRPLVKLAAEPTDIRGLPLLLKKALAASLSEPRGPVYLSLPLDLFEQRISAAAARRGSAMVAGARARPPRRITADSLRRAGLAVARSRHPLIIAGNRVIREGACQELAILSERLRIPVLQTVAAKGALPEGHPQDLGPWNRYLDGLLGKPLAAPILRSADLLLLAGYDLAEDLGPEVWQGGGRKRIIHLGELDGRTAARVRPDLIVRGDIRSILARLADSTRDLPPKQPFPHAARLRAARRRAARGDWPAGSRLFPCTLVRDIRAALGAKGILVCDVGLHKQYAGLFSETYAPNTFICSNGLATFGFALPGAIGASLARPGSPVVALAGDGGFHSNSQDLETMARYGLPVVVVVLSDASYGLIKHYQAKGGRIDPRTVDFLRVDFPALARANGCQGWKADSAAQLRRLLARALAARKPALIEVPLRYTHDF
ncbi:MAG: thiamine pyrophosphate-binding protein [Elusimicrobia bacterium]|nr:thiamine pyrophosphate-binding protein [Elusimicrobiota bacterium]